MLPVLQQLVACETLRGQFPRGLGRRGCLRRQLELVREGKDWEPRHPGCAEACTLGASIRAEVVAAGVFLGTCGTHGTAIVGEDGCEACGEDAEVKAVRVRAECPACHSTSKHAAWCSRPPRPREPETRSGVARESRPVVTLRGAPVTTRCWTGEVPDVPIAPPERHGAGLTEEQEREVAARVAAVATGRRRRLAPAAPKPAAEAAEPEGSELAPDEKRVDTEEVGHATSPGKPGATPPPTTGADTNHEPPAPTPAEEEDVMPKGYARGTPCKTCKATGPRHKKGCAEDGKAPPARSAGRRGAQSGDERAVTGASKVDQLLSRREELLGELGVVEANLRSALADEETRLARLRAAVAASAERAGKAA